MKRLIKADVYYENTEEDIQNKLTECTQYYCNILGISKSTIQILTSGSTIDVSFGSIEEDGYEIYIGIYNNNEINRIIISAGKNSKGKSIYIETREQNLLDEFFNLENGFTDWAEQSIESLELKFNS